MIEEDSLPTLKLNKSCKTKDCKNIVAHPFLFCFVCNKKDKKNIKK